MRARVDEPRAGCRRILAAAEFGCRAGCVGPAKGTPKCACRYTEGCECSSPVCRRPGPSGRRADGSFGGWAELGCFPSMVFASPDEPSPAVLHAGEVARTSRRGCREVAPGTRWAQRDAQVMTPRPCGQCCSSRCHCTRGRTAVMSRIAGSPLRGDSTTHRWSLGCPRSLRPARLLLLRWSSLRGHADREPIPPCSDEEVRYQSSWLSGSCTGHQPHIHNAHARS